MNRNAFLTFATVALIFLYILVYRFDPKEYRDMARFAPADSLIFATHKDGVALMHRLSGSASFKQLMTIDGNAVDQLLGSHHVVTKMQKALTTIANLARYDIIDEIFGKRYGLIINVPQQLPDTISPAQLLLDNLTIIGEPRNSAQLLELLGKSVIIGDKNLHLAGNQYGAHVINELNSGKEIIYFSFIRNFIVLSFNEHSLRKCIDCYDGDLPNILSRNDFKLIRDQYKSSSIFTYLPLDNIRQFIEVLVGPREFAGKDIALKELSTTEGFSGVGYGNWIHRGYVQDKIIAAYKQEAVNELVREHLQIVPTPSTMHSLGTTDPMFYYWSNTLNFKHFLMYLEADFNSSERESSFVSDVEAIVGRDAPQMLELLGDEVSIIVEQGQEDLFFPVPGAIALVEATDKKKIKDIIDSILAAYQIPMRTAHYGPATYYYWARSPQEGLQPLFGFWDDLFFVGNSSETMKRVMDQNITGNSIMDNALFRKADPGFTKNNNSTTFSDNVKVLKVVRKALAMLSTFVALENKETAARAKYLLRDLVFPLLDSLTTFESMASRSYFTPDAVIVESVINLAPPTHLE